MVFSSISFLYFFLPAVLGAYDLLPGRYRNGLLLTASLFFYFWGEQGTVLVLVAMALAGYGAGRLLGRLAQAEGEDGTDGCRREGAEGSGLRRRVCIAAAAANVAVLAAFKYGLGGLALPAGISFFTFQILSYVVDVYRGDVKVQKSAADFLMYVSAFPQLIAGPIVRYKEIEGQIGDRLVGLGKTARGIRIFLVGLAKKVLLANELAVLAQKAGAAAEAGTLGGPQATVLGTWLAAAAFFFQIYYDFSGYSDMAVGLGHMLGFDFPENFDYPYTSASVTEFWRRWHKTLGGWFRDYVYIPLGGNRVPRWKWVRNVLAVWALTGIWHGAEWNFLVWGLYFGCLLILEKIVLNRWLSRLPRPLRHVYTLAVVFAGMVIFRGGTPGEVWEQLGRLAGFHTQAFGDSYSWYYLRSYARLLLAAAVGATPLPRRLWNWLAARCKGEEDADSGDSLGRRTAAVLWGFAQAAAAAWVLLWCTACLVGGSFNPFLYFRF